MTATPMCTSDNASVATRAYAAFNAGEADTLAAIFVDCVWHLPGRDRIAGDMKGANEIMALIDVIGEITGGTIRAELQEAFGEGDRVVTLHTVHAQRPNGQKLDSLGLIVWRFEDGRAAEIWETFYDQYAEDAFWG